MAPDDIVDLFSVFGPVAVRRMFGGAGIYADGTMFALIADGAIYLKAGETNVAMFEREHLAPFTYSKRQGERAVMSSSAHSIPAIALAAIPPGLDRVLRVMSMNRAS